MRVPAPKRLKAPPGQPAVKREGLNGETELKHQRLQDVDAYPANDSSTRRTSSV